MEDKMQTAAGPQKDKMVTIVINGAAFEVEKNATLTFEQIINLGFPNGPSGDGVQYTVQYMRGAEPKPSGTLVEGQSVKAKEGMQFDVTPTNRS